MPVLLGQRARAKMHKQMSTHEKQTLSLWKYGWLSCVETALSSKASELVSATSHVKVSETEIVPAEQQANIRQCKQVKLHTTEGRKSAIRSLGMMASYQDRSGRQRGQVESDSGVSCGGVTERF